MMVYGVHSSKIDTSDIQIIGSFSCHGKDISNTETYSNTDIYCVHVEMSCHKLSCMCIAGMIDGKY